jgi:hypothetical protein
MPLKKSLFYTLLFGLFIVIVYGLMQTAGTGVSLKYQGEEAHIAIDLDGKLPAQEKKERHQEVMDLEHSLKRKQITCLGVSAFSFLGFGLLLYKRRYFV